MNFVLKFDAQVPFLMKLNQKKKCLGGAKMSDNLKEIGKGVADITLNATVKMGLSLIPIVGPALAISYDEINNKIQVERLESFIEELRKEINALGVTVHNSIISNEEFGIVVEKVFKSVKDESNPIKREYFKRLFINGLIINDVESYRIEIFIRVLSELNIVDIKMLRLLHEKKESIAIQSITDSNFSKEELYGSLNKLRSYGFVNITMSSMTLAGPQSKVKENAVLNVFGKNFLDYCLK